jgi:hypothetical protein
MFEFIKQLFKKSEVKEDTSAPILVHADIGETIVVKEVKLTPAAKPKATKPKTKAKPSATKPIDVVTPVVAEVKPVKKPAKPKVAKVVEVKEPTKADALTNIVKLVPPVEKKKGRPKKDKTV